MKVIVYGFGQMGQKIVAQLKKDGHEIHGGGFAGL